MTELRPFCVLSFHGEYRILLFCAVYRLLHVLDCKYGLAAFESYLGRQLTL